MSGPQATQFPLGIDSRSKVAVSPTALPHLDLAPLGADPTVTQGDLWVTTANDLSYRDGTTIRRVAFADLSNVAGPVSIAKGGTGAATTSQNYAFIGPTSGSGAPSFRALVAGDIPTLTAAKISDFDTAVRTSRLDQMATPAAAVSMGSQRITSLADPTSAQDAATKAYVDTMAAGLDAKGSVRAVSVSNITLSGAQTIDGVSIVAGDRVLVAGQTTGANNGIYVAAAGAWARSADADTSAEVTGGMFVFVTEGTTYADSGWVLTTNDAITLGTTSLSFTQYSGAGQITAGAGMTKTGNTLDVVGTANRITVAADAVDIASTYVGQTSITTLGTIATGVWSGTAVAADKGGTGQTSYAVGDLLYASTTTALAKLAGVATGNVLLSGGVSTAPAWGKVALATHVSGTLPVANGGTGLASYTAGDLLYATGATTLAKLAKGAANEVVIMDDAGGAPEYRALVGTTNRVTISHNSSLNSITFTTPQDIATSSAVTFGSVTLGTATMRSGAVTATSVAIQNVLDLGGTSKRGFVVFTATNASGRMSTLLVFDSQFAEYTEFGRVVSGTDPIASVLVEESGNAFVRATAVSTASCTMTAWAVVI